MILQIIEIVIAVLLIGVVLLQMQGSGLSASFGGSGESFRSRRSAEKFLLYATAILTIIFGFVSILLLVR